MNHPPCPRAPRPQRGVALLLAMIVVALVTAAAAAMVWQQERAVAVEGAERARAQSAWILNGALDWARLILREDERAARGGSPVDSLDEPWAQPLAEARLSSFLAADRDNNADSGPEAFISGAIEDAQSRFNLRGVVDGAGQVDVAQLAALTRLVELAGAPADAATRLVQALRGSELGPGPAASGQPASALRPTRWRELGWFGIDEATLERLAPYVDLLPQPTPVNVNTAPREVLAAVVEQLDLGGAERIVQQRQRQPFRSLEALQPLLPPGLAPNPLRLAVASQHFHVAGRLRLEQRVLEERSLVQRRDGRVDVLQRDRHSFALPAR
ncbi:MAG: type II secretion system minor pseudopilin GspK [Ideonella sp. WA131b]|nr:type II secretion system minor pseudopilin GspK [Ideonella sp. WA131b]